MPAQHSARLPFSRRATTVDLQFELRCSRSPCLRVLMGYPSSTWVCPCGVGRQRDSYFGVRQTLEGSRGLCLTRVDTTLRSYPYRTQCLFDIRTGQVRSLPRRGYSCALSMATTTTGTARRRSYQITSSLWAWWLRLFYGPGSKPADHAVLNDNPPNIHCPLPNVWQRGL